MNSAVANDVISQHLVDNPEAQRAAHHDPEFAAELHRLRLLLGQLDAALVDEGLGGEVRHRVASRLVADLLGTDEANARIAARAEAAITLYEQNVVRVPLPADWQESRWPRGRE